MRDKLALWVKPESSNKNNLLGKGTWDSSEVFQAMLYLRNYRFSAMKCSGVFKVLSVAVHTALQSIEPFLGGVQVPQKGYGMKF